MGSSEVDLAVFSKHPVQVINFNVPLDQSTIYIR